MIISSAKLSTLIVIVIMLSACGSGTTQKHKATSKEISIIVTYQDKLNQCKSTYPFTQWRKMVDDGLDQYTEENCNKAKTIFDNLISGLIKAGEAATEKQKVELFEKAVTSLNRLNDKIDGSLIETGEREELCALIDKITIAAGLNPDDYGDGGGIADKWREW
ncbi:hypothetical protein AAFN85_18775 [Mucilaginibacter sp. CAU 1740]|uniref:hypothetical protein n=1 Tax=Mucilaginibacter sp. CAU 1740 TaxID=3140365 RepID=UPI00325B1F2A